MRTYQLQTQLWLPRSQKEVFDFFAEPKNLERLTPPWLRFEIITPDPIQMKTGTRLNYRLRLHGFPMRWESEISLWDPPRRFVDRQTRGPYTLWLHEHNFSEQNNGTLVQDSVRYATLGGKLFQKFFIAPDLRKIFRYRHEVLQELFNPNQIKK